MADFQSQNVHETDQPVIEVTIDPNRPLSVGRHVFQLVVVDNSKNQSAADTIEVIILDTTKPTAVINAVPRQPEFGQSFQLSAKGSRDLAPGTIVSYIWTMVE